MQSHKDFRPITLSVLSVERFLEPVVVKFYERGCWRIFYDETVVMCVNIKRGCVRDLCVWLCFFIPTTSGFPFVENVLPPANLRTFPRWLLTLGPCLETMRPKVRTGRDSVTPILVHFVRTGDALSSRRWLLEHSAWTKGSLPSSNMSCDCARRTKRAYFFKWFSGNTTHHINLPYERRFGVWAFCCYLKWRHWALGLTYW